MSKVQAPSSVQSSLGPADHGRALAKDTQFTNVRLSYGCVRSIHMHVRTGAVGRSCGVRGRGETRHNGLAVKLHALGVDVPAVNWQEMRDREREKERAVRARCQFTYVIMRPSIH